MEAGAHESRGSIGVHLMFLEIPRSSSCWGWKALWLVTSLTKVHNQYYLIQPLCLIGSRGEKSQVVCLRSCSRCWEHPAPFKPHRASDGVIPGRGSVGFPTLLLYRKSSLVRWRGSRALEPFGLPTSSVSSSLVSKLCPEEQYP